MLNGGKLTQGKPKANLVIGPLSSKGKQKAKGKKKKLTKSSIPPRVDRKKARKSKDPEKIKCFFYNRKGHLRSKCNEYLDYLTEKEKGMILFVVEACLVEESIKNWVIEFGATNHMGVSLQGFNETRSLRNNNLSLRARDGSYVSAEVVGEGYAIQMACYILNDVPTKSTCKTPYDLWYGKKPALNHFKIWGYLTRILDKDAKKLDARIELYIFVRYPKETKDCFTI
ncbi:hypothetical protein J1N35_007350 [Gossypium stocksii]|uniref:Retrotransposon protein, putative, Ty1-copia subclass n=1 Tax=Gossypium stocksii TaxID=47602 RepID=A0A9D3W7D0_9ROSI|nr:hypothetical protein J1N35_007350 [Gossypium stocksii]